MERKEENEIEKVKRGESGERQEERRNNETISHAAGPFTAASTKRWCDDTRASEQPREPAKRTWE